jgi:hypothetical protein
MRRGVPGFAISGSAAIRATKPPNAKQRIDCVIAPTQRGTLDEGPHEDQKHNYRCAEQD